ncbi:hypothetical protein B6U99_02940 [Candidatus Geothermarchaeota archaeon ex4572_27]|nr:MAG: hypothetical protein B6U99_02940 [Candidatus Geothermarchaeota archaeon ex4572_27]
MSAGVEARELFERYPAIVPWPSCAAAEWRAVASAAALLCLAGLVGVIIAGPVLMPAAIGWGVAAYCLAGVACPTALAAWFCGLPRKTGCIEPCAAAYRAAEAMVAKALGKHVRYPLTCPFGGHRGEEPDVAFEEGVRGFVAGAAAYFRKLDIVVACEALAIALAALAPLLAPRARLPSGLLIDSYVAYLTAAVALAGLSSVFTVVAVRPSVPWRGGWGMGQDALVGAAMLAVCLFLPALGHIACLVIPSAALCALAFLAMQPSTDSDELLPRLLEEAAEMEGATIGEALRLLAGREPYKSLGPAPVHINGGRAGHGGLASMLMPIMASSAGLKVDPDALRELASRVRSVLSAPDYGWRMASPAAYWAAPAVCLLAPAALAAALLSSFPGPAALPHALGGACVFACTSATAVAMTYLCSRAKLSPALAMLCCALSLCSAVLSALLCTA